MKQTKFYPYQGRTVPIKKLSELTGLSISTLNYRIEVLGESIDVAISYPGKMNNRVGTQNKSTENYQPKIGDLKKIMAKSVNPKTCHYHDPNYLKTILQEKSRGDL